MAPLADEFNIASLSGTLDAAIPVTELRLPNGRMVRLDTYLLLGAQAGELQPSSDFVKDGDSQVIPDRRRAADRRQADGPDGQGSSHQDRQRVHRNSSTSRSPCAPTTSNASSSTSQSIRGARQFARTAIRLLYPVVEEQLVLTKRLVLKEEIHVTLRDTERIDNQEVTLHREHLTVDREDLTKG